MNQKKDLGIRKGIPLALLIIFGAALIFQLFLFTLTSDLLWKGNREQVLFSLGNALQGGGAAAIRGRGEEGLKEYLRDLSTSIPGLRTSILTRFPEQPADGSDKEFSREKVNQLLAGNILYSMEGKDWKIFIPLPVDGGKRTIVKIRVRSNERRNQKKATFIVAATSLFYVFVLYLFTLFVFRRRISIPLSKFLEVVRKVEDGEKGIRVEGLPDNELGRLGDVLNSALSAIEGKRTELEEMVVALKKSNEELELSRVQLIRMEKFATIGSLASGLAHEVGNPLMAVMGYAEYLMKNSSLDEEQKDCLKRIVDESKRIEGIVKGLLAHARVSPLEEEEARGEEIVEDILESLSFRKIFENIRVKKIFGGVPEVAISSDKLRQVVMNIILNSVDSMADGGTLTVKTYLGEIKEKGFIGRSRRKTDPPDSDYSGMRVYPVKKSGKGEDRFVVIEIGDTGSGIKSENRRSIFDPFFTTKEPGKGTGLGLSVASAIIDSYGGYISFSSEEERGTVFQVYLPVRVREGEKKGKRRPE